MMERPMVIVGGEEISVYVDNTYDARKIVIRYDRDKKCRVFVAGTYRNDVPETEITDMCKGITVIDHITYRRIKREISIAVGDDVFWGIDKCYKDDKKKALIERACKDLKIPYTYDSIEEHTQARA